MLAALQGQPTDYVPCSFMIFANMKRRCKTAVELVERQVELGLDACAHVGYLQPSLHPQARMTTHVEKDGADTIFVRQIETPKGPLTQRLVQREGWPDTPDYWIFTDYVVPRAKEVLVKPEQDLAKLPYVLGPSRDEDIAALRETARAAEAVAGRHGLLMTGGYASNRPERNRDDGIVGADAMAWLSGYVDVMTLSLTDPEIIREYMRIITDWNLKRIQVYLEETKADLIIRRAWYETTEFWTPAAYRAIIAPQLKREVDLVHQAGRLFGLLTTSAFMPLLDDILAAGVDVLIGLDPEQGKGTELADVKRRFASKKRAIWGGVSGALTVEQGTAADTEKAVVHALATLAPGGGFILSPVDNVRDDTPLAWQNTQRFIETWKRERMKA